MNEVSEKAASNSETVKCPFCGKGEVSVIHIAGYVSYYVSRISAGAKRIRFYHAPRVIVSSKCPNCGATKKEIKEALERGSKSVPHEELVKRLKEAGLPTQIEFKV